ncbi:hypothetical protein PRK78_002641 [Emydomyces testavorans]|uniref:Uncharacterized protein n=1 Tax=Emydomyces testavorans TaxID=2070801 RepID=A0AAF0IJU9_9EURO|nr:hypothetical protein PRK78_002641 [Emydomyces testavorans]
MEDGPSTQITVADIQSNSSLWYRLHVFTFDLRNFATDTAARDRLNSVVDVSYLGKPYFTPEEVEILKSTHGIGGSETLMQIIQSTLDERLNRRMKKRVESGDFRVCAAHDLAPVFEKMFGINPKKLAKNVQFANLRSLRGLRLKDGDDLGCLVNRGAPKMKGKKKHR